MKNTDSLANPRLVFENIPVNSNEAERYLLSLGNEVATMKLGLEAIRRLLTELGNPHERYRKVQVAGTNGKGSVCAFLDSICRQAGISVGLYTSPHLISMTERVKIDGVDISEAEFARLATRVRETAESLVASGELESIPTYFEQVTAIALLAFAEAGVELAILETGLGGRLDATTAAGAEIAAITRIDLDHQKYLGDTIEEIAAEKAAIIHAGSRVCIGRQLPAAMAVIEDRCAEVNVRPRTLLDSTWARYALGYDFVLPGISVKEVEISLQGEHQVENAGLAILVARELKSYFRIRKSHIRKGIASATHPGRLESFRLPDTGVWVFLDGAHNPAGAKAIAAYFTVPEDRNMRNVLLFGAMDDKNVAGMLKALAPVMTDIVLTEATNTRSLAAEKVSVVAQQFFESEHITAIRDYRQAFEFAIERAKSNGGYSGVLVTGSLYLVGEVRNLIVSNKLKTKS